MTWDIFVSYASEERATVAEPLAEALRARGFRVWFDRFELKMGDRLRRSIDGGLANSRYGIVILSPRFFSKDWTQVELDGLSQLEVAGRKVILPIWVDIDDIGVRRFSPMLADRIASRWSNGLDYVLREIAEAVGPPNNAVDRKAGLEMPDGPGWSPKMIRIGLQCGMLSQEGYQIAFSQRFLNQLITQSEKEFSRTVTDPIKDVLQDILIGASLLSKDRTVRIFESDMLAFIKGISLPVTNLIYDIGRKASIFQMSTDQALVPHEEFFFDLLETLSRLESAKDIELKLADDCYGVVLSHFLAHDSQNSRYSYLVATFVLLILAECGYKSNIVDQIRSWLSTAESNEAASEAPPCGNRADKNI